MRKWTVGSVTCEDCGYSWVAVRPVKCRAKGLECPKCGRMSGKPKPGKPKPGMPKPESEPQKEENDAN